MRKRYIKVQSNAHEFCYSNVLDAVKVKMSDGKFLYLKGSLGDFSTNSPTIFENILDEFVVVNPIYIMLVYKTKIVKVSIHSLGWDAVLGEYTDANKKCVTMFYEIGYNETFEIVEKLVDGRKDCAKFICKVDDAV